LKRDKIVEYVRIGFRRERICSNIIGQKYRVLKKYIEIKKPEE
jgi:hypothetical protein